MELILNIPTETLYILLGVMLGAICALHIISALCKEKASKMLQYVNVFLHILLFGILLLSEIKIDLAVAFYMISLYVYVAVRYAVYRGGKRGGKKNDL